MELPPRTRRIRRRRGSASQRLRTTSAYAENTSPRHGGFQAGWNYLRVRGEYVLRSERWKSQAELPPRTRRIQTRRPRYPNQQGTTSAYAENTNSPTALPKSAGNYLRVRGEYPPLNPRLMLPRELPPRTRRIQPLENLTSLILGTTSAYAENTILWGRPVGWVWNYLRVRGEYS